jgi:hypothetical protein
MRKLPGTSNTQDSKLHQSPTHDTSIGMLRHVSKLSLPLPLENLLLSDIGKSGVQILDFGNDIAEFVLVVALDARGLANGHVDFEFDVAGCGATGEPALGGGNVGRGEADAVVAGVCGGEGKAAFVVAALGDDAVVVVEDFVDADVEAHVRVGFVSAGCLVPLCSGVVA